MKKLFVLALAAIALGACDSEPKFKVEGEVAGADGKMLYMEASALEGIVPMDSVKLSGSGAFSFKGNRPESPEFYRLRIEDKIINFSVDSTETLRVKADYENFATGYTVEGSPNSEKIKELSLMQLQLQGKADALAKAMQSHSIGVDVYQDSLMSMIQRYKEDVKVHYIFSAPNTASAYFALFQKLNNYLIFDPLNSRDDIKCFAAVATSLNNYYPHADRSKNLYNIVIKGMKNTRIPQQTADAPAIEVHETGVIDIELRDMKGNVHKLSELKGKAVVLDFTVYQTAVSASRNYLLRELYDKYAASGLEIYQVSLDADEHYWKTTADNLPWICVRDANGVYSSLVTMYNLQNLPTLYLVNRNNELSGRVDDLSKLEAEVKALL